MKAIKNAQWVLVLLLPLFASTGNASGINDYSLPAFTDTGEMIKIIKKGTDDNPYWQLRGIGLTTSFLVGDGNASDALELDDGSVAYQANFNSDGKLITQIGGKALSNFLLINGSLPAGAHGGTSWSDQPYQLLLKADLLDTEPGNGSPDPIGTGAGFALGFNTHFTDGWAANNAGLTGGSTGESLWLFGLSAGFNNLVKALDGDVSNGTLASLIGSSKTINDVSSVAAIPVPGAVWLFGTGLMTMFASRRKSAGQSKFAM
ncbi:MAG: PEP-CTERM sorting domain-containing protein [Methylococcaceae bacterium]|nr:PEP-CTERM sorting domain-containing protein [Methylococcaceae bacterium]